MEELNSGEICQIGIPGFTLELERSKLAFATDLDKPSLLKLFQVVGHGGGGDGLALPQRAAGDFRAVGNLFKDGEAARIGNRTSNGVNACLGESSHGPGEKFTTII